MTLLDLEACAAELAAASDPTPAVTATTRAVRRMRAEQLAEIHTVVASHTYLANGYRSAAAWLCDTTGESYGQCTRTLHLAERITHMPHVRTAFAAGDLPETALRLLTDAWTPTNADAFTRDEHMLLGWATTLPARDLKLVIDTWRMHTDPDRESSIADEHFDNRAVHLSQLLDGVGRLDGTLDPEGYQLLHEAIRLLSHPTTDETRTTAQRRHDALIQMAKLTLDALDPATDTGTTGGRRHRPTVIATATTCDLSNTDPSTNAGGSIDTGGTRTTVPITTIARLACDCDLHRYLTDPHGHIIDYGRRRRLVTNAQFELLTVRTTAAGGPAATYPPPAATPTTPTTGSTAATQNPTI